MKILFLYNLGIGNCIQMIPLYNALEKHYGRVIDVGYLLNYGGDVKNAGITPNPVIEPLVPQMVRGDYDYIIRPPFIQSGNGDFFAKHVDNMREQDSEFERNMRILDFLGIEREIIRTWRMKEVKTPKDYVVLHNGCAKGWEAKRYPKMEVVAYLLQKAGIQCASIGAPEEYIHGTENFTGLKLTETAYVISKATAYLGTDTGSYHIAALMEKPGLAIFTKTDIGKCWDKDFHHNIETIQRDDLDCIPCMKGFHHMPVDCNTYSCQDIAPELISERLMAIVEGDGNEC